MSLNINLSKSRMLMITLAVFIYAVFSYQYVNFVAPKFSYMGFVYDFNFNKLVEAVIISSIILLSIPKEIKKPSDFYMVYMFFLILFPVIIIYPLANYDRLALYIVISNYFIIYFFRSGKPFKIFVFKNPLMFFNNLIFGFVVLVTIWALVKIGLPNLNFDITQVYDFRKDNAELVRIGFLSYVVTWIIKSFLPYLLVVFSESKKYFNALLILMLFLIWFALLSQRSIIFYPLIVLLILYFYNKTHSPLLIPFGISLIIITLSIMTLFIEDLFYVKSLFYRRVFFLPSLLTYEYIDFFQKNDHVLWSNSITKYFIDYPYSLKPPELIANELGRKSHANNSFFSTGYMHFGILGTFFYAMIVGVIFKLMDSIARKRASIALTIAITFIPFHSLIFSADLPTALLTHGIFLTIILLIFIRNPNLHGNFNSISINGK